MTTVPLWVWGAFMLGVFVVLALDLGVFHRRAHTISLREATIWSILWIVVAMAFNGGVYLWLGPTPAKEFFTGYLIERALSVDNLFVFFLIFQQFAVPDRYQHRVLFWGILGALAMRGAIILSGAALIQSFDWLLYVFGAFLIYTAIRIARETGIKIDPQHSRVMRVAKRVLPLTDDYHGSRFVTKIDGRWFATPLLLVLLMVETTDLVFAVDSIPAIFAVTKDPFIIFTSNVCAIFGLRALYFLLAGIVDRFYYLKHGLAFILFFVGVKMVLHHVYEISIDLSLLVVVGVLALSMVASYVRAKGATDQLATEEILP